jgi:hypothetical protein
MQLDQPVPFQIVRNEGQPAVATNGAVAITCPDAGGRVFLRRGLRGSIGSPVVERILPALNQLAGELVANSQMDPGEVAARLHALQLACAPRQQQAIEWAVAELDGVRAYTDGSTVVLTRQDMAIV